jgi:hypothetical protein
MICQTTAVLAGMEPHQNGRPEYKVVLGQSLLMAKL